VHLLMPAFGNHGLWAALMIWLGVRAVTLALWYPRIERQAAGARLATRAPGR
jgi:MATE family multidrug resistance protein